MRKKFSMLSYEHDCGAQTFTREKHNLTLPIRLTAGTIILQAFQKKNLNSFTYAGNISAVYLKVRHNFEHKLNCLERKV